uniref:Uncharacterized protein n=1 Tax=Sinocyclocheilus grahami TaxID=75366 RepID=A0A672MZX8_SINGR
MVKTLSRWAAHGILRPAASVQTQPYLLCISECSLNVFVLTHLLCLFVITKNAHFAILTAAFVQAIHRARLEPTKKYSHPQTEAQEIGWLSSLLECSYLSICLSVCLSIQTDRQIDIDRYRQTDTDRQADR